MIVPARKGTDAIITLAITNEFLSKFINILLLLNNDTRVASKNFLFYLGPIRSMILHAAEGKQDGFAQANLRKFTESGPLDERPQGEPKDNGAESDL